jgi:ABC-type multidrug transport system fused ATPase/permease subunit
MLASRPVPRSNIELWLALLTNLVITLVYLFVLAWWQEVPAASGLFGHSIGILGFLLMLTTELLYSLRKRSLHARWGRLSNWLRFHIYTGLVGPYMVLLHSSWKFNGLAGVVLLLTLIIVISGFIGRYIYTAIPRTADGIELESEQLSRYIAEIEATLSQQNASLAPKREKSREIKQLRKRQLQLKRQLTGLARARRGLAIWHTVHVPIGIVLFLSAFIHIIAAIYYVMLAHLFGP